jgi:hypothetical protein
VNAARVSSVADSSEPSISFWEHALLVLDKTFKNFPVLRDAVTGATLSVATVVIQAVWGLVGDWQTHKWRWVLSILIPFGAYLLVDVIYRSALASWRVYVDLENRNKTLRQDFSKIENDLELWKAAKPQMEIELERIITRKSKNEDDTLELFLQATITLVEPRQVSVAEYSFVLSTPRGAIRVGRPIDDLSEWRRVAGNLMFELPSMPTEFTQRGEKVNGWFHFKLRTSNPEIMMSRCVIEVVTLHGTNNGEERGQGLIVAGENFSVMPKKVLVK